MNAALRERMAAAVAGHDANVRAAVVVATESALKHTIGGHVDAEGWVEWDRLAADLVAGLAWSSGEQRLARLACSLVGKVPDRLEDWRQVRDWSLAETTYGLDASSADVVLRALALALTGAPTPGGGGLR